MAGPSLMIAGASGVVPFRAMLRHRQATGGDSPARLLYSARSLGEVVCRDELVRLAASDGVDVSLALTRESRRGGRDTGDASTPRS